MTMTFPDYDAQALAEAFRSQDILPLIQDQELRQTIQMMLSQPDSCGENNIVDGLFD